MHHASSPGRRHATAVRPPLTAWDRVVYGAIASFFGLAGGALLAFVFFEVRSPAGFNKLLVLYSGAYFFGVGFARGPLAADLAGGTACAAGAAVSADVPTTPVDPPATVPSDTTTVLLFALYVLGALLIAYLA